MDTITESALRSPQSNSTDGQSFPLLEAGGFSDTVDAYAWEPEPHSSYHQMHLWFLSLLGSQESVKALWARLIKGEVATLVLEALRPTRFCVLAPEGPRRWRFVTASLRSVVGYQGVLVPEAALYSAERPDFLLLPRSDAEAASLHYRFLNRRLDLPLHPYWTAWFWERGLRTGEVVGLEGQGTYAYRCVPDADALARDLGEAVRRGSLPLPDDAHADEQ